MAKFPVILTIMLTLVAFGVMAEGEYLYPYYNDGIAGTGFFNTNIDTNDITTLGRNIAAPRLSPLVGDLDADGTNEIVVVSDNNVYVYGGSSTLPPLAGNTAEDNIKHAILYDIDGDTTLEVLTGGGDKFTIFDFNGTSLILTRNYTSTPSVGADWMIACRAAQHCAVVIGEYDGVVGNRHCYIQLANTTGLYWNTNSPMTTINNGDCYLPKIPAIEVSDIDEDGTTEYIFTIFGNPGADYVIRINTYSEGSGSWTKEDSVDIVAPQVLASTNRDDFTAPIVYNFDPTSNKKEVVIGFQHDNTDQFIMHMYSYDLTYIDRFPDVLLGDADGVIISNIIRANAFPDTDSDDFCVMGYDTVSDEIDLLCASKQSSYLYESYEFVYDGAKYYDITTNETLFNNLISAAQHSTALEDGANLDEIITPYGVFSLDYNIGFEDLNLEYEMPYQDGAVISADVEKSGRDDLLILTASALWYVNDGYSNTKAEIDSIDFNPCYDATWQQNTTSSIVIHTYDADGDVVQARAVWYLGETAQYDTGWSANASQGTAFAYSHVMNETIAVGKLRIAVRDGAHPALGNDSVDITFSVGSKGVEFGETECTSDYAVGDEEDETATIPGSLKGDGLTEEEIASTIGVLWTSNSKLKALLGLLLVIIIMVRVASWTNNAVVILAGGVVGLVLAVTLTLLSAYLMIIVLVGLVMLVFLGNKIHQHGGGG